MARLLLFSAACVVVLTLAACRKPGPADAEFTFSCSVAPQPARVGLTTVTVRLISQKAQPLTGARLRIEGDMSHPGMEPVFANARETAPGNYVARFRLTMPGDWVILVQGNLADGQKIDRQVDLKGVLPG